MLRNHHSWIQTLLVTTSAVILGQVLPGQTGPGVIRAPALNKAFPVLGLGVTKLSTAWLVGSKPGVFTCSLTFKKSPAASTDLVIGHYDQGKGTFLQTKEAGAFNTTSAEQSLSLEPLRGRYAVFLRYTGPTSGTCFFSARKGPGVPFPTAVKIKGAPSSFPSIAIGSIGGKLKLFYSQASGVIQMQDLNITNLTAPTVTGTPQVVARSSVATQRVAIGSTITGPDGDVEGLVYAQGSGSRNSSIFVQAGLDPKRPGHMVVPNCGPTCGYSSGGVAGGRLVFIKDNPTAGFQIYDAELSWILGDVVRPGGTADIVGAVSNSGTAITLVLMSTGVRSPLKLPNPFNVGHLGLSLNSIFMLGTLAHTNAGQRGSLSFKVPNVPRLRGVSAAVQGLSLTPAGKPIAWTNTAWIN